MQLGGSLDPETRIRRAILDLCEAEPFYGSVAMHVDVRETDDVELVPTAGVLPDGVLLFNPAFVDRLDDAQLRGLVAHEVLHLVLDFGDRRLDRDRRRWNTAQDAVINHMLVADGFDLPPGGVVPEDGRLEAGSLVVEDVGSKTSESIYDELVEGEAPLDDLTGPNRRAFEPAGDEPEEAADAGESPDADVRETAEDRDRDGTVGARTDVAPDAAGDDAGGEADPAAARSGDTDREGDGDPGPASDGDGDGDGNPEVYNGVLARRSSDDPDPGDDHGGTGDGGERATGGDRDGESGGRPSDGTGDAGEGEPGPEDASARDPPVDGPTDGDGTDDDPFPDALGDQNPGGFDVHLDGERGDRATDAVDVDPDQRPDWGRVAVEAAQRSRRTAAERGTAPASAVERVRGRASESVDWRSVLREQVTGSLPSDYTWRRPADKSRAAGTYLPDTEGRRLDAVVALDTSASMATDALARALGELRAMEREYDDLDLTLVQHDAAVHRVDRNWLPSEAAGLDVEGRGGTSHRPVFAWLREERPDADLLVAVTDGLTEPPERVPPGLDVVWVLVGEEVREPDPGVAVRVEGE